MPLLQKSLPLLLGSFKPPKPLGLGTPPPGLRQFPLVMIIRETPLPLNPTVRTNRLQRSAHSDVPHIFLVNRENFTSRLYTLSLAFYLAVKDVLQFNTSLSTEVDGHTLSVRFPPVLLKHPVTGWESTYILQSYHHQSPLA